MCLTADDTEVVPPRCLALEGPPLCGPCENLATDRLLDGGRHGGRPSRVRKDTSTVSQSDMGRLHRRRRPVHQPIHFSGNRSVIVFVTVCTHARRAILANPEVHAHLIEHWLKADHWLVGRYILMPDHLHLFCSPGISMFPPVKKWVAFWKSQAAAAWPSKGLGKVWQRDAWDRQLRSGESYHEKWAYVRRNPVRRGLVADEDEWSFQGELNALHWHDC